MNEPRLKRPLKVRPKAGARTEPPPCESPAVEHSIAALSGLFKDDPLWDEFVQSMERARTEEDAKEDVSGRDQYD